MAKRLVHCMWSSRGPKIAVQITTPADPVRPVLRYCPPGLGWVPPTVGLGPSAGLPAKLDEKVVTIGTGAVQPLSLLVQWPISPMPITSLCTNLAVQPLRLGKAVQAGSAGHHNYLLGYPFNRSKLRGWVTLVLARTIRSPWASSGPMRTA